MNFEQYNHLSGYQAEDWFREFSIDQSINREQPLSPGSLIRLLHKEIPVRLRNATIDIGEFFPSGETWINQAISTKTEPNIPPRLKTQFNSFLMDYAASTDVMIVLPDASGKSIKIAVDITVNPNQEDSKICKIRGLPDQRDRDGENRNQNIGRVRKALGIDKHLVVLLDSERDKLPSHRYLLTRLREFAQGPSKINALHLKNLAQENTIGGEYRRLSVGLEGLTDKQKIEAIAAKSIAESHRYHYTAQLLMQDKAFHNVETISQAVEISKSYAWKALTNTPDYQILWAVRDILQRFGKEKNGVLSFDGKRLQFRRMDTQYEILAKDARGIVFAARNWRSTLNQLTPSEQLKLKQHYQEHQKQSQQKKSRRGR